MFGEILRDLTLTLKNGGRWAATINTPLAPRSWPPTPSPLKGTWQPQEMADSRAGAR